MAMIGSNPVRLAAHVVRGQWFMVFSSFLIMAASGATYAFAIYSKDIKSALGYDQKTLNTLGFFKDVGSSVGILSGLINEVAPPWVVLSIGAAMNLSGYLMVYLAITGRVARPSLPEMCLYLFVGSNSQSFANTGALVTCVYNFPASRGTVIGLLKGFVGLSSAIFTQLYLAIYGDDSKSIVLLIAWLPAVVSVVSIHSIRVMKVVRQKNEFNVFCRFLYASLALAGYLMVMIVAQKLTTFSPPGYRASAAAVVALLFLPLAIVVKEELALFKQKEHSIQPPPPITITIERLPSTDSTPPPTLQAPMLHRLASSLKSPPRGEDYTILQALVSVDMLILFFSSLCGIGGTLTAIDNMGQIGESLGYPSRSIATFISLISIWNYMGRVAAGFASEILLKKYRFPRPLMLALVLVVACSGHLLIAFGVPGSLYVASVIIGFCFGAQMPLLFAMISEIFGLKYYSTLYNLVGVASPLASYVLNVRVTGSLYDLEAARQGGESSTTCMGVQCFRLAFFVITAATVAGAVVMMVLVWRTRDFYRSDIYARFREAADGDEAAAAKGGGGGEERDGKEMTLR